jgi:hypothetical protein
MKEELRLAYKKVKSFCPRKFTQNAAHKKKKE